MANLSVKITDQVLHETLPNQTMLLTFHCVCTKSQTHTQYGNRAMADGFHCYFALTPSTLSGCRQVQDGCARSAPWHWKTYVVLDLLALEPSPLESGSFLLASGWGKNSTRQCSNYFENQYFGLQVTFTQKWLLNIREYLQRNVYKDHQTETENVVSNSRWSL